jgi:VanZ family protein
MYPFKRIFLILALLLLFILFFISGPGYDSARSLKHLWNMGHILFYALLALFIESTNKLSSNFQIQLIIILVITLILGVLIEMLQIGMVARTPDMGDVIRNIIGALVGLFFLLPSRKTLSNSRRHVVQLLVCILVLMQLVPAVRAYKDERSANRQFPLLSGFEISSEINRWTGGAPFEISHRVKKTGSASLQVMMNTDTYSGLALKYFPGDWRGYRFFQFSIFNPDNDEMKITCRIHDRQHTQGQQEYADRFNRSFSILKGWQTIIIPLDHVKRAPENRQMDMKQIQSVGIFSVRLPRPRTIYIDDVRLNK